MPVSPETLRELIAVATKSPSSHNTQPWLFRAGPDRIDLYADTTRRLAINDPEDRELVMSCGAALLGLRVAAAKACLTVDVHLLPNPDDPSHLAHVRFYSGTGDPALRDLYDAVGARHTHRGGFGTEPLHRDLVERVEAAAEAEGAVLSFIPAGSRHVAGEIVAEGDRAQFADPRWRRELASWMHTARAGEGLPVTPVALPVTKLVLSLLDLGRKTASADAELARSAPGLAVLSTAGDGRMDWLKAGQAVHRVLLVAAPYGVAAGFLNQPCQVGGELRKRLATLTRQPVHPQMLMRLGTPEDPSTRSARRPVDAVLIA